MKINLIVFDWAGTIIDYGCFSPLGAFIEAFKQKDIIITMDEAREPMGMLKIDHTRAILNMKRVQDEFVKINNRSVNENDVKEIYEIFESTIFSTLKNYVKLNPYVLDTIKILKEMDIKIGSTTGYTKEMMDIILPVAKKLGYNPEFTISSDEVENARPYADMMIENANFFGIDNMKSVVKVGDTVVDMKEGKNAGAFCVGIVLGSSELGLTYDEVQNMEKEKLDSKINKVKNRLLNAGADYVINDISELPNIIRKINKL